MDGGKGPRIRDFLSGSLATWSRLQRRRVLNLRFHNCPCAHSAPSSRGAPRMIRGRDGPAAWRLWNLNHLWGRLRDFYQEELQLLILSPPPDLQMLGFDPFSEEAVEELEGILRLLLGASVQCEHRELFIRHIQGLSLEVQSELAAAIQEVTQPGAGLVLALTGPEPGELAPPELEMLSRSLMGTLLKLARERDLGAQRLAELLLDREPAPLLPEAPAKIPSEGASHHLALQLANAKAQLRRLRWRRDRPWWRPQEERALSGALEASKALLEEQLEAAQERCARLHETQRENLLLRTRLGEAHAELDSLRHQVDQLAEENVELELELQRSLEPPPGSPGEELLPGVAPSLHDEVREAEAGRLQTLERENQELRGLLRVLQRQPGGQPPLLEEQNEDSVIREPDLAPQTCLTSDPGPQALAAQAADEGSQASDPTPLLFESALEASASDLDPQVVEKPLQTDVVVPADSMPQESDPDAEAQEFPKKAGLGAPLRTPSSVTPPQGPEVNIQAQLSLGGETGESVPEALRVRQEDPESKPGPSETSLCVRLEEQGTLDQKLDLPEGQTEAREHEHRLGGLVGDATQRKSQKKLEGAPEVRTWEARAPEEILVSGVPEREALQEEAARLKREAETLRAELEAQARRLEARGTEAACLSEELAQARRAEAEELEKAVVRGRELGARLERLQNELERAALERQEFLREQEFQHQRYQGLEQRLEAELQAAATSKEEALMELRKRALQLEDELFKLRQGAAGLGPQEQKELKGTEAQSMRLIEVEPLPSTAGHPSLWLSLTRPQLHLSHPGLAEKSVLETQGQELHRRLGLLEEEVQAARRSQEETRGQQQALLRDHEALAQLQRRQEAELEGLLARHRDLKANMRALELAHRELQGRHEQLQAQKANVEAQEVALLAERERLVQDGHRQRGLEEELRRLQSEHDRAQMLLAEVSRERGELQGERGELRGRLARLELERAQLEAQSQRLRESNQQLDLSACRLTTQCELLTELRSAQEEENRQLLAEVQALSRENRELLERSLESRDHLHREQREYLDQLNALRREKQKLVEKIMDQYRVLEPGPLPRTKKGSWLADKVKRLMRPRREGGPHGGPRLGADGAGSTESLGGPSETELPEGREADGTGSPSPAPMRRAQSSLCLRDETLAGGQRRKLSSRFPVGRSSESFSPGDTPRQRFRQRRPGPLGAPSSHGKGPGVGWGGSIETLAEHEADANGESLEVQEPEKRTLAPSLSQ
ncbi:PREDICTED: coiled-coil domain-containing protein 88B [Bison bison bison]|uniref:Coiled-coil domain-containing protein 88B n=1 Tax=Bison bison bison TaxID=43346 RepID=A0A6P3HAR4_BISBB|nr:PREDICTED: coiled-coil domain-containing protein 88B [Bison bison bison]